MSVEKDGLASFRPMEGQCSLGGRLGEDLGALLLFAWPHRGWGWLTDLLFLLTYILADLLGLTGTYLKTSQLFPNTPLRSNWITTISTKPSLSYTRANCSLTSLILIEVNEPNNLVHNLFIEAFFNDGVR